MKKLIAVASIAVLAACSQPAEEAPVVEETTAAAPATPTAADVAGTYDVKMADGSTGTTTINADGSYVDTDAKGVETKGMWAMKDGKSCFDPEGDEPEVCWTDSEPDANGVFTATAPDGTVVTVTPQAKAAATTDTMATPAPAAT